MGAGLLAALAFAAAAAQSPDTTTYATEATHRLIARAIVQHHTQDSSVTDYRAKLRYRLSFSIGRRKWGAVPTAAVEEQEGRVAWQLPNDLRVDLLGQRFKARNPDWQLNSIFDEPWFVPRGLNDSVRVFGADFPQRAALHPLAADGPDWYRYWLDDSVAITTAQGRRIRLFRVEVTPKRGAESLIAGRLWLDAATAEVVRVTFRYVGNGVWVAPERATHKDSSDARKANKIINRIFDLSADLEYALQEGRYWMPYRQIISGRVSVPFIGDYVFPFEAITGFSDYQINSGTRVVFALPMPDTSYRETPERLKAYRDSIEKVRRSRGRDRDSLSARVFGGYTPGGHYEIHRPHRDSLRKYSAWGDSLTLELSDEDGRRIDEVQSDLARLVDHLPNEYTGLKTTGFGYERLADVFHYNRVHGLSTGLGYQVPLKGLSFATLYGTARYGMSDHRLDARISLVRDAPGGKLTISAYHDLAEADPFSRGLSFGNSLRAIFAARDEADYYLATGAGASLVSTLDRGWELTLGARFERQRSVTTRAKSAINDFFGGDGIFAPNPEVQEGDFMAPLARLDGAVGRGRVSFTVDGLFGGGNQTGRAYGNWRQPIGGRRGMTLRLSAGAATGHFLPQSAFRAGGLTTVRGFTYGTERGQAVWSLQTDWSPIRRRTIRPVLFADAGQAGALSSLGHVPVMLGGGLGLSALGGLVRIDLSHRISDHPALRPFGGWRVDLVLGGVR